MNPTNGKGSTRRKGADDKKFKDNYDKIFGNKKACPECGMVEPVHKMGCSTGNKYTL